jgi:hypothetical protein
MLRAFFATFVTIILVTITAIAEVPAQAAPTFPAEVSPKYSAEPVRQARLRTCRDQHESNREMRSPNSLLRKQDADGYLSECVRRLTKQAAVPAPTAKPAETVPQSSSSVAPSTAVQKAADDSKLSQSIMNRGQPEPAAAERAITEQTSQVPRTALRQKLASDYGIEAFSSVQELAANPFPFRGRTIGLSVAFGRMVSESEALFSSNGELIVARVPSTAFRGTESVILAVKVIGYKSVKMPVGGENTLPYVEVIGAWPLAEKRGKIIGLLREALLAAAEIKDEQTSLSIEQAIDVAISPVQPRQSSTATVGIGR